MKTIDAEKLYQGIFLEKTRRARRRDDALRRQAASPYEVTCPSALDYARDIDLTNREIGLLDALLTEIEKATVDA